jgi:hypothetical protein
MLLVHLACLRDAQGIRRSGKRVVMPGRIHKQGTLVWLVKLPEVPVTVTVTEPVAATAEAAKVKVLLDAALLGLKDAVTPAGSPDAARVTLPLKPLSGVMVIVCADAGALRDGHSAGRGRQREILRRRYRRQLFTRFAALTLPIAGGKVPTHGRSVGRAKRAIEGGENTDRCPAQVAVWDRYIPRPCRRR